MCTLCQSRDPSIHLYESHVATLAHGAVDASFAQSSGNNARVAAGLPEYTVDQAAAYLTTGFWQDKGATARSFNVTTGGSITVNLNGLDSQGRATALQALDAWTNVSGINFTQSSSSSALMTFDDNRSGAYASSTVSNGTILQSRINVDDAWQRYGDYYLQTYIHEIGHAMGLGHSGNYNGSASYGRDAHFANDSWQMTVMSYFDQNENTNVDASRVYVATAQVADIAAIQSLYGTPTTIQTGDSIYGDGNNTGQFAMNLPAGRAVTIVDNGGTDTINLASRGADQTLDLRVEHFSDINGRVGNLAIGRNTVIENAITGAGNDRITGNAADNRIESGAGNDTLTGNDGDDVLFGGAGRDVLTGGAGADTFAYSGLSDAGDTIQDFQLAQGDKVDIRAVLQAIGYTGDSPEADGIIALQAASGGAYLMVDADGSGGGAATRLAFLVGLDARSTTATAVTDSSGVAPEEPGGGSGGGTGGGSTDTIYRFSNSFIRQWTPSQSVINDVDGGTDTLDLREVTYASTVRLTDGASGRVGARALNITEGSVIENLLLGTRGDRGYGNDAANLIDGGAGHDRLYGGDGDDSLIGGTGNDRLYGGNGVDHLTAGDGNDLLYGNIGDDILDAGGGNDRMRGGWGHDRMNGGDGRDDMRGELGNDTMDGGAGNDRMRGGWGHDQMAGGDDRDDMRGELGNDTMDGGAGNDLMRGGDGNDVMTGGAGRDFLRGENGNDVMSGGAGNDKLYGNDGNDVLRGGGDRDYLRGGNGDDAIFGDDGADKLYGDRGADTLDGGAGADQLWGGADNDVLAGGSGADKLDGSAGDDTLHGGADDDRLYGGAGNDVVIGGLGADRLSGNGGADVFVYETLGDAGDQIRDFSIRHGDRIDVSALLGEMTAQDAIDSGVLSLSAAGRSSWLVLDLEGDGNAVQLVLISNLSSTTELSDSWVF